MNQRRLDELGLTPTVVDEWRALLQGEPGIVLVSGPMGSGRTSVVIASVPEVAIDERAAFSVEDPVECEIPGITQYEVLASSPEERASAMTRLLHSFRRRDPDFVLIGEIRDRQSMELACDLATSGIRVMATVHATSGTNTVRRLLEWGIDPFVVSTTLRGVLCLRLLERLCPQCRVPVTRSDGDELWPDTIFGFGLPEGGFALNPDGCPQCFMKGTAEYFPIGEVLPLSSIPVEALRSTKGIARLGAGLRLLEDQAYDALVAGETHVEAVRHAQIVH
jgi:type II secretory ATPase GspE/PulE/Tfp pilus assembly ATPase PilB-like protein